MLPRRRRPAFVFTSHAWLHALSLPARQPGRQLHIGKQAASPPPGLPGFRHAIELAAAAAIIARHVFARLHMATPPPPPAEGELRQREAAGQAFCLSSWLLSHATLTHYCRHAIAATFSFFASRHAAAASFEEGGWENFHHYHACSCHAMLLSCLLEGCHSCQA